MPATQTYTGADKHCIVQEADLVNIAFLHWHTETRGKHGCLLKMQRLQMLYECVLGFSSLHTEVSNTHKL